VAGGSSTTTTAASDRGGQQHVRTTCSQSSNTVRGQLAKRAELSSAYSALAAELTKTEIKSVGGYTLGKIIGQGKFYPLSLSLIAPSSGTDVTEGCDLCAGTFGKVRLGVHRLTGTRVAIKQVSKSLPSVNVSIPLYLSLTLAPSIDTHKEISK